MKNSEKAASDAESTDKPKKSNRFHFNFDWHNLDPRKFKTFSKKHKIIYSLAVLFILIFSVPFTRYPILGLAIKKELSVKIVDTVDGLPISEAIVEVQGKTQKTDNQGEAKFTGVKVGPAKAVVTKKYYETTTFKAFAGVFSSKTSTGKVNPVGQFIRTKVVNKITGKEVANATIKVGEELFKTDDKGLALVVIAKEATEANVEISADGFNNIKTKVTSDKSREPSKENTFGITQVGKIYFLSKLSGKIDVVKTNFDGTDRQTVLAGTGSESETGTILLASRDWKYLALLSKRDNSQAKLYLIDTTQGDKLSIIDEGKASFDVDGWLKNYLIFRVNRDGVGYSQPGGYALKTFDAQIGKLTTIDQTEASTRYIGVIITQDVLFFGKNKDGYYGSTSVYSIKPDNSERVTIVKDRYGYKHSYYVYTPVEVYFAVYDKYYEYSLNGHFEEIESDEYYDNQNKYVNFVVSPDGKETFWAESRDGKNSLFIGNLELKEEKQIASLSEFKPYGWYGQDYVLVSKNGSELYILSRTGEGEPVKVSDYHKPNINYNGYGYGYGGN